MYSKEQYLQFEILEISKHKALSQVIFDGVINLDEFKEGDVCLYLGEIPNMLAHVAVATRDGKVKWGYHEDNFRVIPEDDSFVWED